MLMTHGIPSRAEISELCVALSSVMSDLHTGYLQIFDVGRCTDGFDLAVHLFSNNVEDNGVNYIDFIAHSHHMSWGKLVDDSRSKDLVDWQPSCSSVVHYPVLRWSEFAQHPTETAVITTTPCVYCKRKVEIHAEAPSPN